jgi:subtilisin family serine protease
VASIIGARLDGQGTAGIAPESELIALRACEQIHPDKAAGRCYSSSILKALDLAMEKQATIVNMSIGTRSEDTMVASALDTVAATGMVLVAPAGNDPTQTRLSFPASHAQVISVAGQSDNGHPMPNATVASQADIILPGQYVAVDLPGNRTSFMHGTSMASAKAAGLFASLHPDADRMADCRKQDHLIACLTQMQ